MSLFQVLAMIFLLIMFVIGLLLMFSPLFPKGKKPEKETRKKQRQPAVSTEIPKVTGRPGAYRTIPKHTHLSARMLRLIEKTRQQPPETWPEGVPGLEKPASDFSAWRQQMSQGFQDLDLPARVRYSFLRFIHSNDALVNGQLKAVFWLDGKRLSFDEWIEAIVSAKISLEEMKYQIPGLGTIALRKFDAAILDVSWKWKRKRYSTQDKIEWGYQFLDDARKALPPQALPGKAYHAIFRSLLPLYRAKKLGDDIPEGYEIDDAFFSRQYGHLLSFDDLARDVYLGSIKPDAFLSIRGVGPKVVDLLFRALCDYREGQSGDT